MIFVFKLLLIFASVLFLRNRVLNLLAHLNVFNSLSFAPANDKIESDSDFQKMLGRISYFKYGGFCKSLRPQKNEPSFDAGRFHRNETECQRATNPENRLTQRQVNATEKRLSYPCKEERHQSTVRIISHKAQKQSVAKERVL